MYSEAWKKELDPNWFWNLIDLARKDYVAYLKEIENLERREIIRFAWYFEELASALGGDEYRNFTNEEFSEDVLDDLWEEVVGKGKTFYEDVIQNPQNMPAEVDYSDLSHKMRYDMSNVFFERYQEEIPPFSYDY